MSLPAPDSLDVTSQFPDPEYGDSGSVNVAVYGDPDPAAVDLTEEGYVGAAAGATGRLAAARAVVEARADCTLQRPAPDFETDVPWLVLAPLAGFLTTVATGTGRVVVTADYDGDADPSLDGLNSLVTDLLDAARPTHDHYPVADDARGVFTTGMTTFSLDSLAVDDAAGTLDATFAVATTPATTGQAVESRFADVEDVSTVEYESVAGVERADPSPDLRAAAEAAHHEVTGDAQYDWLRGGDVFARIPGEEKVAFGAGAPGSRTFSEAEYETCVTLLDATLNELEVGG